VKNPEYEENIQLTTQPFGICSHAQYFPKFVAQIFIYEMKKILNNVCNKYLSIDNFNKSYLY
jgi:hypothetical protein